MDCGTSTLDAALTAGAASGAVASTVVSAGLASGEASGDAVSADALKPTIAKEIAAMVENNFFIVVKIKSVDKVCVLACLQYSTILNF